MSRINVHRSGKAKKITYVSKILLNFTNREILCPEVIFEGNSLAPHVVLCPIIGTEFKFSSVLRSVPFRDPRKFKILILNYANAIC